VLRVKFRLDITVPLRRGILAEFGADGREKWCPITYEFLPNFCYVCGIVGHVERVCKIKLGPEEQKQYGCWLKYTPQRKKSDEGSWGRGTDGRNSNSWRGSSSADAAGKRVGGAEDDWRKNKQLGGRREEKEVTSPLKLPAPSSGQANQRKLSFEEESGVEGMGKLPHSSVLQGEKKAVREAAEKDGGKTASCQRNATATDRHMGKAGERKIQKTFKRKKEV
jgi:hypothetical protein